MKKEMKDIMNRTAEPLIHDLDETLFKVIGSVYDGQDFALIDFPNHSNVGDSAIWKGEIDFFARHYNKYPRYVCHTYDFDLDKMVETLPDNGIIFIHGGGNFGDIWPDHMMLRYRLWEACKNYKIIQLPQSIHFQSEDHLKKTKEMIAEHPDFHLMVRDHESLNFAQTHFDCPVSLAPDMALAMGALKCSGRPVRDVLFLKRTDKEGVPFEEQDIAALTQDYAVEDWLDEESGLDQKIKRATALRLFFKLGLGALNKNRARLEFYNNLAQNRIDRGRKQLSRARLVISDRLHVHILCLLLGIPHIRLDNNYGKISNFAKAWTEKSAIAHKAGSVKEAAEIARKQGYLPDDK